MSRRFLVILLVALPAVLTAGVWLAFRIGWLPQSIVYLRVSLGVLFLFVGLILTSVMGGVLALITRLRRRSLKQLIEIEKSAATRHRRFLARLDHELKNPLTAIQVEVANLETESAVKSGLPLPEPRGVEERPQTISRLKDQVARLNDLLIQLRKLGELESEAIERDPVRLDDLLTNLVKEFRVTQGGEEREINLNLPQIPWPLPQINGDIDLLYVAFRNLLDNAVKFTEPGNAIQVRAFEDSDQVLVEIADKGFGIPETEQEHVWEELYRGEQARGLPGSGLGLTIVKAIIEIHGGRIALRSRPNRGTVVTIRLPVST
jgi:two-component system OmpR family sensor kinase